MYAHKLNYEIVKIDILFVIAMLAYGLFHVSCWSNYPPDVDPMNFFLALLDYNVSQDRPHPPGYPGYVAGARALTYLVSPSHAYQLLNLGMITISAAVIYKYFRRKDNASMGLQIVALIVTHPLVLAATIISESYVSDLMFSVLIYYIATLKEIGKYKSLVLMVLVFFLCGMFRVVSCAMLLPLAIVGTFLSHPRDGLQRVLAVTILACCATFAAYQLTVLAGGGVELYKEATARVMGRSFAGTSIFGGASISDHLTTLIKFLVWFSIIALIYPVLLLLVAAISGSWRNAIPRISVKGYLMLVAWVGPPFAFYVLIYYLKPTYNLIYLVPLLYVAIKCAESVAGNRKSYLSSLVGIAVVAQTAFFLAGDRHLPTPLYRLTFAHFKTQDMRLAAIESATRSLKKTDMQVWVRSPSLPPYLARLSATDDAIAILNQPGDEVFFWRPYSIRWEKNWFDVMNGREKVSRIMLVTDYSNNLQITWHAVPDSVSSKAEFDSFIVTALKTIY